MISFMRRSGSEMPADESLATIARTLQVVATAACFGLILWLLDGLVLELFVVVMLSLLLRGLGKLLARVTRLPVGVCVALVTVALVLLAGSGLYYRGPRFLSGMQELYEKLGPTVSSLRARYGSTPWGHYLVSHWDPGSGALGRPAMSLLGTSLGRVGTFVVVVLAAIYMAAAPHSYLHGFVLMFPVHVRARASRVMQDCGHALQWWMLGQAIAASCSIRHHGFGHT